MAQKRTRIGLLGENVSESPSPAMHNAAFQKQGLAYHYAAISVVPKAFKREFEKAGRSFLGLNITIPYKEVACGLLSDPSARVEKLDAVNTVIFSGGKTLGENTDVDGLRTALTEVSTRKMQSAFILGAGGAGRATVEALVLLGVKRFVVATRSQARLRNFKAWFAKHYVDSLECIGLDGSFEPKWKTHLAESAFFVNASPLAAVKHLAFWDRLSFPKGMVVVDWVYSPKMTPWLQKGEKAKGTLVPGYKLLLYQGMKSFELWTGLSAPEKVMEKALLRRLG